MTNEDLIFMYGQSAIITRPEAPRRGFGFVFVHLDKPNAELLQKRTATFDPDTFFNCDCHICALTRIGGIVVFDDSVYDDEFEGDI